ncbi:MAG: hypothetical protein AAF901_06285 [Bacteroidota bacterium]
MNTTLQISLQWILAVLMIVFGLNKFFGFISVDPPSDPVAQQFMGAMFGSYLSKVVAINEILGGLLLLIPKTRFLGWLFITPVMFNIVAFHMAHDFIGNGIWLAPTILFIVLGYFHKAELRSLLNIKIS